MSNKRPLDAVAPGQEAAPSPRKRLRRTVLVMMWLERRRRARHVTVERMAQMVRQVQLDMAKLFMLLMVLLTQLASMESLLANMLQGLLAEQFAAFQRTVLGSIQDRVRSVVRAEIQERQAASLPNGVCERSRQMPEALPETGGSSRLVKLRFVDADRPKDPLYTGSSVQWQNGQNAKVAIFRDGRQIMGGDLSKLQIEILPVHADFFTERGQEDFTEEEFNKQIYSHKEKESVLATVNLTNGEAYLGSFFFRESSYGKKLRLTARVKRLDPAVRVQEAISDPFIVKVGRSKLNEKSYPPSKEEPVHCLEKISLKGKHCKGLTDKNITTVKHFMRHYHKDKSSLQKLTDMKKEDWSTLVKHATTSDPGLEIYSYRVAEENTELLFNDFYDLVGMMINGSYIPSRELNQFQQLIVKNWKISAYNKFEELENSGGLIPDYMMFNGRPVCAVSLNNDAGPSVQAATTWPYPNDMAAQQGAGLTDQQNGSLNSLTIEARGTSFPVTELGQHGPSMPQNGTLYNRTQENILSDHGPFSGQPTVPSQNFPPVGKDDLITGASPTDQQNGYLSSLMTDAPGTSCPVTDGLTQGASSFNHGEADIWSDLSPIEEFVLQVNLAAEEDFVQDNNELPNFNNQFGGSEHDGGNP